MTAQKIHQAKIKEHLQVLKDAIAVGMESRPATIGFHASACAIDLLETYLHKTNKIPIGKQIKHEWFKRPKPGQKIKPLAERQLSVNFPKKQEIFEFFYILEENRNKLIYGHATVSDLRQVWETFNKVKESLLALLQEEGEEIADSDS